MTSFNRSGKRPWCIHIARAHSLCYRYTITTNRYQQPSFTIWGESVNHGLTAGRPDRIRLGNIQRAHKVGSMPAFIRPVWISPRAPGRSMIIMAGCQFMQELSRNAFHPTIQDTSCSCLSTHPSAESDHGMLTGAVYLSIRSIRKRAFSDSCGRASHQSASFRISAS